MARGFNSNYFIFFIESIKNGFIISTLIAFISIFIEGSAGDNSTFFILGYWFANIFWFAFFNIIFLSFNIGIHKITKLIFPKVSMFKVNSIFMAVLLVGLIIGFVSNKEFGNLCNILPLFIVFFVWVILNVRFLVLYQSR
jgi:hypothetical protein